ncbi:recombinase family protein [Pyxidicoccus caerfyrddinensis]|uniref:recombinase family protein n=1 Tax=Pyxidicoccus caerfyrddinensis TaxID=2709663 RepID=UPI0013DB0F44|nr:recombinase family protein [Pyxidicoccus caerfyrddinensis]
MTAVAYLRVSSKTQDFPTQRSAIERAAAARGDTIGAWYAEKRSGKTMARPEMDRLRADARAGHVHRLYVFRLDRLTRSGIRDTFELIEELRSAGVEVISIADGFFLDGPAAEVILAVMSWAAKMERLAINERIAAARERVEAEGKGWGRPSRFTGADLVKLEALRNQGRTIREIAIALKVSRSTVQRSLAQKVGAAQPGRRPADEERQQGAAK